MKEVWKKIEHFPKYEISNLGNVRRFNNASLYDKRIPKYTFLKQQVRKRGYCYVRLYDNYYYKTESIHRLVGKAFIPNPNNLPQINHKDENPTNNIVENLEWCDNWYNSHYGKHIENCIQAHFKKVEQYDLQGNFIKTWNSIIEASNDLKIDSSSITKVCKGKRKTSGGYIWKYERRVII